MGVKLVLDDHDYEVLEEKTGEDFSRWRQKAAEGTIRGMRFSSIESVCRALDREPGDILKLTDE